MSLNVFGQEKGWELGGDIGIANYFGDLNTEFDILHPGITGSIKTRYNLNKRLAIGGGLRYAFLQGRDEWSDNNFQQARNLSFRSHTFELFTQLEFNFLEYEHGASENFFTPYIFAGPVITRINPQGDRINAEGEQEWVNLKPLSTEGQFQNEQYRSVQLGLQYGFGFKYNFTSKWSLNILISGRKFFTDYIDDVSTVYPNKDELRDRKGDLAVFFADKSITTDEFPNIGEAGRQRGDATTTDMYATLSIGIMYYFAYVPCPKISRIRPDK